MASWTLYAWHGARRVKKSSLQYSKNTPDWASSTRSHRPAHRDAARCAFEWQAAKLGALLSKNEDGQRPAMATTASVSCLRHVVGQIKDVGSQSTKFRDSGATSGTRPMFMPSRPLLLAFRAVSRLQLATGHQRSGLWCVASCGGV